VTETPAKILRRAAELMRERAEHAAILNPSPWTVAIEGTPEVPWVKSGKGGVIAPAYLVEAEHIAAMHPGVALALADWLDDEATNGIAPDPNPALKFARTYLGEENPDGVG
jgi:hypothetical protein